MISKKPVSWATYELQEHHLEHITEPSLTRPDEAMTVKQLYDRYARGEHLEGLPWMGIDDEDNVDLDQPDLDNMDLAELEEYKRENDIRIDFLKQKLKDEEEEKTRRAKAKADDATDDDSTTDGTSVPRKPKPKGGGKNAPGSIEDIDYEEKP